MSQQDSLTHNKPLKILHVLLSMGVGGAEKLVYDMILHMDHEQYQPSVCCLQQLGPLGEKLLQQGIPVFSTVRKQGFDFRLILWLRELIRSEQIDVIHAHQYTPMFYSVLASLRLPVKIVYTEHGRLYPERRHFKRYLSNPLLAKRVAHLVSISHTTKAAMANYDNFPLSRIQVVHNGVDCSVLGLKVDKVAKRKVLGIPEDCRIIGTAARLDSIKNLPMMFRAFKRVLDVQPDTCLLIAGTGPQEDELKQLTKELEIAEQVKFFGLRFDLPEIYQLYEVFLLSSRTEGISITLLEAMASGVPVVATDVGGNSEVVSHDKNGFLVCADDDRSMAEQIVTLLRNSEKSAAISRAAIQTAQNSFSFKQMLDSYLMMYSS